MLITINTDASFSHKYQRGTYAYWVVCNLGRIKKSGILRDTCRTPTHAEMKCIVNALYEVVNNQLLIEKVKKIIINTDSLNAIHYFTGNHTAKIKYKLISKGANNILKKYNKIRHEKLTGVEIIFSHIKAHQNTDTAANFVNDWCDKSAKEQMHLLKEKIKNKDSHDKPHSPPHLDTTAKRSWRSTRSEYYRAQQKVQ